MSMTKEEIFKAWEKAGFSIKKPYNQGEDIGLEVTNNCLIINTEGFDLKANLKKFLSENLNNLPPIIQFAAHMDLKQSDLPDEMRLLKVEEADGSLQNIVYNKNIIEKVEKKRDKDVQIIFDHKDKQKTIFHMPTGNNFSIHPPKNLEKNTSYVFITAAIEKENELKTWLQTQERNQTPTPMYFISNDSYEGTLKMEKKIGSQTQIKRERSPAPVRSRVIEQISNPPQLKVESEISEQRQKIINLIDQILGTEKNPPPLLETIKNRIKISDLGGDNLNHNKNVILDNINNHMDTENLSRKSQQILNKIKTDIKNLTEEQEPPRFAFK